MAIFTRIAEPTSTPLKSGLYLLGLNLCLVGSFGLAMGVLLVVPVGITTYIKPWMLILGFAFVSMGLWYRFGAVLPTSHSLGQVFQVCVVGLSPVLLLTGYEWLATDSVGCGGVQATRLILGLGAMIGAVCSVYGGAIFSYRN